MNKKTWYLIQPKNKVIMSKQALKVYHQLSNLQSSSSNTKKQRFLWNNSLVSFNVDNWVEFYNFYGQCSTANVTVKIWLI